MRNHNYRKQKPIQNRIRVSAGFEKRIEDAIELMMKRFKVSRPLIITVGMAEFFGIKQDEKL